jgi:hypothetical protein
MKLSLIFILLLGVNVYADYVKKTVAACSEAKTLNWFHSDPELAVLQQDAIAMELWLIKHDCKVIDRKTAIKVLDYVGKKKIMLKISLTKSGEIMYVLSKDVQIEQPGQDNIIHKF